ncbi:MAG: nuclear transport factor 2 family protein [Mycobacteriales bacterium]
MTDGTATIERLYAAMEAADGDAMAALYASDATFEDPAFGPLAGERIGAMWRMLTRRGTGINVDLRSHEAHGTEGTAHWLAHYRFGGKQRPVVNDVHSTYRFTADGLIAEQVDRFDLSVWATQAMGRGQGLLGRTPILGLLMRRTTSRQLDAFLATDRA